MKLKRLTLILLVVALLAGGLAAFGARSYIQNAVARYQAAIDSRYQKVKVAVAADDLPSGVQVNARNVVTREVPKEFVHKDAITVGQWSRYSGRTTRANLTGGAPILRSQLLDPRVSGLAEVLSAGKRALTVPVDQISSISGLLLPGDRVDILLTIEKDRKPVTFPLMEDIPVLATGVRTDEEIVDSKRSKRRGNFNTVTMLVNPEQAAKVVHAQEEGSLTVVLRPKKDAEAQWPDRITLATLLGEPETKPKPPIVRRRRVVEVILGGQGSVKQ
jgi:pilus assembly protein CpaB